MTINLNDSASFARQASNCRHRHLTTQARIIALRGLFARLDLLRQRASWEADKVRSTHIFGEQLNQIRIAKGWSIEDLATECGSPVDAVRLVVHGDIHMDIKVMVCVCLALGVRARMTMTPIHGGGAATVIETGAGVD